MRFEPVNYRMPFSLTFRSHIINLMMMMMMVTTTTTTASRKYIGLLKLPNLMESHYSGGARILEQVGPEAGSKVEW